MDCDEIILWLKIMRTDLKNFPEISNGKKMQALTNAIDIVDAFKSFWDVSKPDDVAFTKFKKVYDKVRISNREK